MVNPHPIMMPKMLTAVALEKWLATTKRLLEQERKEEIEAVQSELTALNDAENPNVLVNLRLMQFTTALFGRTMLKLAFPSPHVQRPKPHQFTVGDLVQIRLKQHAQGEKMPSGIVAKVEETAISIALGEEDDVEEETLLAQQGRIVIDRLVNNATFVKISTALEQLAKHEYGAAQRVVDIVFSGGTPSANPLPAIQPFNANLNDSQLEAIRFALASKDLALIHGPPGTGKTTTVVEFILQAVKTFKLKVLVCAPSNIAVDNVLEKMASVDRTLQLTRIGHPARLLPQILRYCLDARIADADGTEIVNDVRKEMQQMESQLKKTRDKSVRYQLRRELKANRKEVRQREQRVVTELIKHSDVVFATNVGAASKLLKDVKFDLVVIDEAAQALEASCWIPILKASRCVLAGDHLQLPPTIKSKGAAAAGLETTLFDRVTRMEATQSVVKMLKIQYRMHDAISQWSSQAMYKGELQSFEGVAKRKLHELAHVGIQEDDELLNATLLLLDTAGCDLEEDQNDEDDRNQLLKLSKSNAGEANVVSRHVRALLDAGLRPDEVAVITPYNKQVQLLKTLLLPDFPTLEIRSVDGFQGCEKEAVVMSLVRSNAAHEVGFLADDRRMNVAITRAKRHVAVVCDTETISAHKFLKNLVTHFETHGEYCSAQEYLDDEVVHSNADEAAVEAIKAAAKVVDAPAKTSLPAAQKPKPAPKPKNQQKEQRKEEAKLPVPTKSTETKSETKKAIETPPPAQEEESDDEDVPSRDAPASVFQAFDDSSSSDDEEEQEQKPEGATSANALLKELHLSRLARTAPPPPAPSSTQVTSSNSKSKKNKKKKKSAQTKAASAGVVDVETRNDDEDDFAFLTRQAEQSVRCCFQTPNKTRCKKSTTTLGGVCKFCKLKFCFDHAQPEVHGCGDAVRQFERQAFQAQAAKPQTNKLSADKRKLLQKKLDEKVTAKTSSRTTKAKPKK
ncbi:hypothetical protein Poli38472_013592 [Pythium oligandrum]|uniref:DNA helicase n=1 Tax=Pythium oligandrum TaxID=41045 RepID=A0A8K1CDM6_PYTOL|nr:hypothetical protein Poli38472_013592 [Pythium oligandrum]|eukprot:TMW61129.1 hypothetical protein Poli38472_013592 [Pythium oligandrum]